MPATITHYFDYKSPYAYLAQEELFLAADSGELSIDWLPYTLDIPKYLGTAELDQNGNVVSQSRNEHQWRRVKYAYMDCRREANRRDLTLRGPRKIFDSTIAHIGFLYAKTNGDFRAYHNAVYARFWRRELDIENPDVIKAVLSECGIDAEGFLYFLAHTGADLLGEIQKSAEDSGVFGVPSYTINEELFWGAERFPRAREYAQAKR